MPRFRFVAADSTGHVTDGAIDAATQTDARTKLASNGLAVRELEEVAADASAPPALPRRALARPDEPVEPLPMTRRPRSEPVESPRRGSGTPLVVSIVALVIAVATAAYVVVRDPSNRLNRYDFSTPEDAYRSMLRIHANGDFQAMMELQRHSEGKRLRQKLDVIQINKTAQLHGKTILFVSSNVDAIVTREIAFFERDPDQPKRWRPTEITDAEIRAFNPSLADEVRRWPGIRTGDFAPMNGGAGAFEK
jgi:hypothetical protein